MKILYSFIPLSILILFAFSTILPTSVVVGNPMGNVLNPIWSKVWGDINNDEAHSIVVNGSDVFIAGTTFTSMNNDAFLLKYDTDSNYGWSAVWGNKQYDVAFSVAMHNSSIYTTGFTMSYGNGDAFLLKYNETGVLKWNKTWGGDLSDLGNSIAVDDSGIYIVGSTYSYGTSGSEDSVLIKYSLDGDYKWNKTWGGSDNDIANSISISGGCIYVGGEIDKTTRIDSFLLKYDKVGNLIWGETYTGHDDIVLWSITAYGSNIYGAGWNGTQFMHDTLVMKIDFTGNITWNTTWGKPKTDELAYSIAVGGSGIYVAGSTNGIGAGGDDAFVLKYGMDGKHIWNKTWGGTKGDCANSIAVDDTGIYLAGYTESSGAGKRDIFVLKCDLEGEGGAVPEYSITILLITIAPIVLLIHYKNRLSNCICNTFKIPHYIHRMRRQGR